MLGFPRWPGEGWGAPSRDTPDHDDETRFRCLGQPPGSIPTSPVVGFASRRCDAQEGTDGQSPPPKHLGLGP